MQFWILFALCVCLLLLAFVQEHYVRKAAHTIVLLQKELEARKAAHEAFKKAASDALDEQQANFIGQLFSFNGKHVLVLQSDEPASFPANVDGRPMTIRVVAFSPGNSLRVRYEESSEGGGT